MTTRDTPRLAAPASAAPASAAPAAVASDAALLDAMLEIVDRLVVVLDADGRILRFNRECERVTGYMEDEVLGQKVWDIFIAGDEVRGVAAIFEQLRHHELANSFENDWLTKDRDRVRITWRNQVIRGSDGGIRWVIATGVPSDLPGGTTAAHEALRRAERERRDVEARLAGIAAMAVGAIITIDDAQRITFFNDGAERIFGYTQAEVLGQPIELMMPPRFRDAHHGHVAAFGASVDTARRMGGRREIRGMRKSGEEFAAEASIAKLHVHGVRSYLVVLQDVSAQRRAERALRASEARFQAALDHAPIGTVLADPDGRWLYVNRALCDMLGYSETALLAADPDDIVRDPDPAVEEAQRAALLAGRIRSYRRESAFLHVDRHVVSTQVTFSLARDADGRPLYVVMQVEDISERKRLELEREQLLRREAQARRHAERAELQALFLARASTVLDASLQVQTTLGAIADLVVPAFSTLVIVDLLEEEGTRRRLEVRHAAPEAAPLVDRLRDLSTSIAVPSLTRRALMQGASTLVSVAGEADLRDVASDPEHLALLREFGVRSWIVVPLVTRERTLGAVAFVRDHTAEPFEAADLAFAGDLALRAVLAIDNAQQFERARAASALRDQVLGVVSHDLRNPLTVIAMYATALSEMPSPDPDRLRDALAAIQASTDWMQRMIGDLLDVANIDAGHLALTPEREDPFILVMRVFDLFRGAAAERGITLAVELPEWLPPIFADGDRVVQAVGNLVANAIKFTEPGGRITLGATAGDEEVFLTIEDTGAGISSDQLPRIFDRFWHARKSSHVRGSGLGLAIVRGIVEAHGGHIDVESEVGRGSRFTIALPRWRGAPGATAP